MPEHCTTECRAPTCNAHVIHGHDDAGHRVVLDARRHPIYIPIDKAGVIVWQRVQEARVSHFATCADPQRFTGSHRVAGGSQVMLA